MRYPDFLGEKGKIGFIAPSFGCTTSPYKEYFENALSFFHSMSYETVLGPNCYADNGIGISNTPQKCGEEVNDFFINDKSDIIISCGGGELMCEDLPFIDFAKIKGARAKWYMGYSDNTNLTFLLNILCDTASIYGPNAPKYGVEDKHISLEDAFSLLKGEKLSFDNYDEWFMEDYSRGDDGREDNPDSYVSGLSYDKQIVISDKIHYLMPYNQRIFVGEKDSSSTEFTGRIVGGCLDCLVNLVGTCFDKVKDFNDRYEEDGIIWFMESCDLNVFDIRRALWHMENAGWFKNVKGFIIGRPLKYNDRFGDFDHIEAVRGILGKYNVPIVMDIDLGHIFPAVPVMSGSIASIKATNNKFNISYEMK